MALSFLLAMFFGLPYHLYDSRYDHGASSDAQGATLAPVLFYCLTDALAEL